MNITKLAQERGEAIYATVKKKKSVSFEGEECAQFCPFNVDWTLFSIV